MINNEVDTAPDEGIFTFLPNVPGSASSQYHDSLFTGRSPFIYGQHTNAWYIEYRRGWISQNRLTEGVSGVKTHSDSGGK